MEVVVGRMTTAVSFCSDRRAKDDQVPTPKSLSAPHPFYLTSSSLHLLGDTRMNNKHAPHRTPGIIPHPLLTVPEIRLDPRIRIPLRNTLNHILHQCGSVARVV